MASPSYIKGLTFRASPKQMISKEKDRKSKSFHASPAVASSGSFSFSFSSIFPGSTAVTSALVAKRL